MELATLLTGAAGVNVGTLLSVLVNWPSVTVQVNLYAAMAPFVAIFAWRVGHAMFVHGHRGGMPGGK